MKIAILSFYSGHYERGVENWAHEIAKILGKKHEVTIYQNGESKNENYKTVVTNRSVNWKTKDLTFTLRRFLFIDYWSRLIARWTVSIFPQIYKKKYDVVIPTNGGWQVALVRIATWLYGGKMVVVGHSGKGWDERNNLWSFPDAFVSLTKSNVEWAKRFNPFIKVVEISDGVDLKKFNLQGQSLRVELKKPLILVASALEKGKRVDLAIEAVSKMKEGSLLVLGKGSQNKHLEKLGRSKLGSRFMIKAVSHEDIPKYYRSVDLFTLPSWKHEAFGMVYLEAMSCGLPVVATNDEIRREIVGDAGILIDPTDINEYSKALERASKKDWGDKPRIQAEKFSWDKIAEKYEKLFEELTK